jgi:hypothetical protein
MIARDPYCRFTVPGTTAVQLYTCTGGTAVQPYSTVGRSYRRTAVYYSRIIDYRSTTNIHVSFWSNVEYRFLAKALRQSFSRPSW